jgi:hypothetical protein
MSKPLTACGRRSIRLKPASLRATLLAPLVLPQARIPYAI